MVKLTKVEDRPTPPEVYNWRVYVNAMVAAFAAVMIGYDSAFIGTSISLTSFKKEFGMNHLDKKHLNLISANIVSMYQAGCFFGAFFGYPLGFYLGRKWGLVVSAVIFNIGAILQTVASASTGLGIIYAGRVIAGLAIGAASNLAPIYIAEISPPAIRGRLIGLYELGWQIGGVTGFFINYGVVKTIGESRPQWLIAFAVQIIPGGLLLIGAFFLIESPRWLSSRNYNTTALSNLSILRHLPANHPYVQEEMADIQNQVSAERKLSGDGITGPIRAFYREKKLRWRLFLGISLFAWQNGTGINAINYYSPTVFRSIGITGQNTSLLTTGVFGIIKLLGALAWLMWLVDTLGRRKLLMIGAAGGAFSMYYVGAYIAIAKPEQHPSTTLSSGGISAVAFFYLWTVFYSPSWNGTPWVYGAEIFPTHVRTFTSACLAASNWLFAFIIARNTPTMFTSMGYGVYMLFASLMVLAVVYVWLLVPETKRVPLERMDELFGKDSGPAWKAHEYVMSRESEGHGHGGAEKRSSDRGSLDKSEEERVENNRV